MIIRIGIWGSNCVGKTFICNIIKDNSKYPVSAINFFENKSYRKIIEFFFKISTKTVLFLLYKIFQVRRICFLTRFFWIMKKYSSFYISSSSTDFKIFLYEEGLIKKMYEIYPFKINGKKSRKLVKDFLYISPELLSIERCYMDGFIYVYSEPESVLMNMKKREFYLSQYNDEEKLKRYEVHNLLYSFLIHLCRVKEIPVITIDSYDDRDRIVKNFDVFVENLIMRKKK